MSINLIGLPFTEFKLLFENYGLTILDAKRVFPWIHKKNVASFDEMSDVPLSVRTTLSQKFTLSRGNCIAIKKSNDGTEKAILQFSDSSCIETVFIPDDKRNTICVSSQVGCAMGCKFCHTGTQGFTRNLTSAEIMAQVLFWKDQYQISNIVFMGMGEPLLNSENLFKALTLLLDKKLYNFSRQKITVSTCGIIEPQLLSLAKFGVKLAISLHAPIDELRTDLMPINRKYKLSEIISAAKQYKLKSNTEYVTFEYLLLKNVNDSSSHAKKLIPLLHSIPAKVNLITYNDWPEANFYRSDRTQVEKFAKILTQSKIRTIIRKSRGDDILAACGQLKYETCS
ncbi:MAG: 23S rRNA (adenine(2503)-C(2))-methyltransferase RlmN [Alphaproteobacteria bacterium]|nr:23S rRNA (adenine(2503)-C(2))-methyltransferase RlmN [Alphaproteobacteria bacterium]